MSDALPRSTPVRHEPERTVRVGARTVTLLPSAPYDIDYVPMQGIVGFAFDAQAGTHGFADERDRPFYARPNTLSWLPSGCDVRSRAARGGEYLTVALPPHAVPARESMRRWSDRPCPEAARAARALRAGLLRGDLDEGAARLFIEAFERAAFATPGAFATRTAREAAWLTDARLRRMEEYLDACLDERTRVAELAAACDVSPGFLTRIVKAATGLTPHAWLLDRRLVRARALLAAGDTSLADIAPACGFASHSHLTATMRRRVGVLPGRLR